jgi:hypothetical protein
MRRPGQHLDQAQLPRDQRLGLAVPSRRRLVPSLGSPVTGLAAAITSLCGPVAGLSPAVAVGRQPVAALGDLLAQLGRLRLRAPGLGVRRSPPDSLFVFGTARQQPPGAW